MKTFWFAPSDWLLHCAVGGGFLLLVAYLLLRASGQPARRQVIAQWGVLAALVLAALSLRQPWLHLPLLESDAIQETAVAAAPNRHWTAFHPEDHGSDQVVDLTVNWVPDMELVVPDTAPASESLPGPILQHLEGGCPIQLETRSSPWIAPSAWMGVVIAPAYALVAVLLFGRWLLGYLALARILRRAHPASRTITELFAEMNPGGPRPRLLVTNQVQVPFSCGLWRPTVVLPRNFCRSVARDALRWVFAHELTHLRRRDALSSLLFGLGQVLYFYVPWFWWLRNQVRLSQEYIADAAVLDEGADPEDYAELLLSLTRSPAVPMGATGVLGNSSDLFRRVTMLLQSPKGVEKCCPRSWSLLAAAGLLALGVVVSGISLRAQAAALSDEEQQKVEKRVTVIVNDDDDTKDKKKDKEKEAVKKAQTFTFVINEDEDQKEKKEVGKKIQERRIEVIQGMPDVEEILKKLPKDLDPEKVKAIRDKLEKAQGEVRRALEEAKAAEGKAASAQTRALQALRAAQGAGGTAPRVTTVTGVPSEGRLGISVEKPNELLIEQLDLPKDQGLIVREVRKDSAASKVGIKPNDILLEVDGKAVSSEVSSFLKDLNEIKSDSSVNVTVLRKGRKETLRGLKLPEAKRRTATIINQEGQPGLASKLWTAQPLQGLAGQGQAFAFAGNRGVMTTTVRHDDHFTTRYQEGTLVITITGDVDDGKAKVNEVVVNDGGKSEKYSSVNKVPEQYRDKVKTLIEGNEKGSLKIEVKPSDGAKKPMQFRHVPTIKDGNKLILEGNIKLNPNEVIADKIQLEKDLKELKIERLNPVIEKIQLEKDLKGLKINQENLIKDKIRLEKDLKSKTIKDVIEKNKPVEIKLQSTPLKVVDLESLKDNVEVEVLLKQEKDGELEVEARSKPAKDKK